MCPRVNIAKIHKKLRNVLKKYTIKSIIEIITIFYQQHLIINNIINIIFRKLTSHYDPKKINIINKIKTQQLHKLNKLHPQ